MEPDSRFLKARILDANLSWFGHSLEDAMEKAGRAAALEIQKRVPPGRKIAIFCGPGNKGGDGLVAARHLSEKHAVTVFLLAEPKSGASLANFGRIKKLPKIRIMKIRRASDFPTGVFHVFVDALVGSGLSGDLREPYRTLVRWLNAQKGLKVAVDVPTGFGSRVFFRDDLTVSMHASKKRGALVADVGIPKKLEGYIGPGQVRALRLQRGSHKGQNGVLTVIGGSRKYHGAPLYAIEAAAPFVDLVYFHSPEKQNLTILRMKSRSNAFITAPTLRDLLRAVAKSDAVLIGNGLEENTANRTLVNRLLRKFPEKKFVLDAGALMLADKKLFQNRAVLTPHAGEFARCFGKNPGTKTAKEMARRHHAVVLLKSPVADIVTDGRRTFRNFTGNVGMTRGGTGDTLAGLVAAFATQNDLFLSAQAAVFLNGLAGDLVAQKKRAFTADDVARAIPDALETTLRS